MRVFLSFAIVFLLVACNKDPLLIDGNEPPPDYTVEDQTINNYITKSYISLLSREPDAQEKQAAFDSMRSADFDEASRQQFLDGLFSDPAYLKNVYNNAVDELLRGADSTEIYIKWLGLNQLLNDPQLAPFYPQIQMEIDRLEALMDLSSDLSSGAVDVTEMYRVIVDNPLYDDFNMGTENFIVSTFQFFLHRAPTDNELIECTKVVDGQEGIMFLQTGESKSDYLDIFFSSDGYYEGQVIYLFEKYLFRQPYSEEMTYYAQIYQQNNDYAELQKLILSLDEFAGI